MSIKNMFIGVLLVALVVALAVPAAADRDDNMVVGRANGAKGWNTSLYSSNPTASFSIFNTNVSGAPALSLTVNSGPALEVNTTAWVRNLNADRVDGQDASDLGVPSGAVMFFYANTCPSGWSPFSQARGRTIVGLRSGGTLGGVNGTVLTNLGNPSATSAGSHNHLWAYMDQQGKSWRSYTAGGDLKQMSDWGDGIGNEGSGYYPIAPSDTDANGTATTDYYTTGSGGHTHNVNMPYVQLLVCKKD